MTCNKMLISVKAKPKAKENKIEKLDNGILKISVKEPPEKGKANFAIVKLLSQHFKTPQSHIRLIVGATSSTKIFEINI